MRISETKALAAAWKLQVGSTLPADPGASCNAGIKNVVGAVDGQPIGLASADGGRKNICSRREPVTASP